MRLLLAHGADPKINTVGHVSALQVAAGIGWVDGLTYEWSPKANEETVKLLLDLGLDPNLQAETGRTALHGAGHKGRTAVTQMLVDAGANLEVRDYGMTGNDAGGRFALDQVPRGLAQIVVRPVEPSPASARTVVTPSFTL